MVLLLFMRVKILLIEYYKKKVMLRLNEVGCDRC